MERVDQVDRYGVARTIIHLVCEVVVPPTDGQPEGPPSLQWRIACMPNMTELHATAYHPHYQRSDAVPAVTCPACKKTKAYEEVRRRGG